MSVVADLELTPGLDEVRELARTHNLVPLRHTFIADCETPVSAYLKLRGDGPSFLLESAEQGQRIGRWSFLGCPAADDDPHVARRPPGSLRGGRRGARPLPDRPARGAAAVRGRRGRPVRLRPRAQRGADRRGAQPRRGRHPGPGADGHRRAGRVRPPAPRGDGAGERAARGGSRRRRRPRLRTGRRGDRGGQGAAGRPRAADRPRQARAARVHLEHGRGGLRGGRRARQGVHPRRRRLPGRAEPALDRRLPGGRVLDLPRPAGDQPEPVHVLPRLRGLRDRGRLAGVARHGDRPARRAQADRRARGRARDPTPS